MGHDERTLLEAIARRSDEGAFRELYSRHTPRLYQFVLRLLGGAEADAEDAVQETWIRACRGLQHFRGESAFATWLTGIGVRVSLDLLRQRPRERVPGGEESPDPSVAPAPTAERIDLERAIAALPSGYRTVVVLHDVEGMTHREIAGLLGISEGTSKSQLFEARRAIRARLRPSQGETP